MAKDFAGVLRWIGQKELWTLKPNLFRWSMRSTGTQLAAQHYPELVSPLVLFGYWHDVDNIIKKPDETRKLLKAATTAEAAAGDFIVPASINQKAINAYIEAVLVAYPIRVDWNMLEQDNELDPKKVTTPTHILQGEF